ncbi:hypothetical protein JKP88DRAFT_285624 [Tribonema minus]|uniref:Trichohyalin-plectin-homology domain-containing protein n=1 Tax=Tribonema minus TaxID=303371 RepID=A0A835ZGD1_9STRA|nr:hypothetical protein JKP88DRAFT_285624 [Tribonema minus]
MLAHKFVGKLGTKYAADVAAAVKELLERVPQPTDADLGRLESDIHGKAAPQGRGREEQLVRNWCAFAVAKQIEDEEKKQREQTRKKLEQERLKQDLKRQMEEHALRHRSEALERKMLREASTEDLQRWRAEQDAVKAQIAATHDEERRIREDQIANTRSRQQAEHDSEVRRQQAELARITREAQEEVTRAEEKKAAERARLERIKQENAAHRIILEQRAKEAAEQDMRLMQEYKERLDKEEADRAEKLRRIGAFWTEKGAGKKEAEEQRRAEALIVAEANAKERADIARELHDREKKRTGCINTALQNRLAMEERRRRQADEQEKERVYLETARKLSEADKQAEAAKRQRKRSAMLRYTAELERQMAETRRMRQQVDMSETEALLNADMIARLEADVALQGKVKARMGAAC